MRLQKIFFILFLIAIPFGTRILLYQFTPGFNEYSSAFLYASDIFLILFLISYSNVLKNIGIRNTPLFIFLLLAAISVFLAVSKGLAVYNAARLFLLALAAIAAAGIIREGIVKLDSIFAILAGSAVFQSLLGFLQFIKQSSLGLGWLGESVLGPDISGAAKIVVDGVKILRAYGTFPHPNVLAAFLLLGLFSLYYLWLKTDAKFLNANDTKNENSHNSHSFRIFSIGSGIFLVLTGLILTFSRTAWAIGLFLTLLVMGYELWVRGENRKATIQALAVLVVSCSLLITIFSDYIFPRAQISPTEPAVVYRLEYNKLGLDLIKDNPLGVGIGNQVLHAVENGVYQKFGMDQAWQWQPVHNIYLLIASEMGLVGLLSFGAFFISLFLNPKPQASNSKQSTNPNDLNSKRFRISMAMLISLLLFGLFDHFFWTLQSGRLMLWLVAGILMWISSARGSTDRTHPSEG